MVQDLLAAADIGEMLLEKNRALSQKLAEVQAKVDEQVICSQGYVCPRAFFVLREC